MYQSWSPSSWLHIRPAWLQTPCTFLEHWSSVNSPQLQHEKLLPTIALSKESTETLIQKNLFAGVSFYIKILFKDLKVPKGDPKTRFFQTKIPVFCWTCSADPRVQAIHQKAIPGLHFQRIAFLFQCPHLQPTGGSTGEVGSERQNVTARHDGTSQPEPYGTAQNGNFPSASSAYGSPGLSGTVFQKTCRNGWTNKWSVENILLRQGLSKLFAVTETTLHKSPCSISVALL